MPALAKPAMSHPHEAYPATAPFDINQLEQQSVHPPTQVGLAQFRSTNVDRNLGPQMWTESTVGGGVAGEGHPWKIDSKVSVLHGAISNKSKKHHARTSLILSKTII